MTAEDPYTVDAARRAAEADQLAKWVTSFLASPGSANEALAAELAFDGASFLGPVRFALDDLHPLAGPDTHDVNITVPEHEWDQEVDDMDERLAGGWEPPPLLVSYRDGVYLVEDGNHRHDALRRAGATHTWAILVFWDDDERSAVASRLAPDATSSPSD